MMTDNQEKTLSTLRKLILLAAAVISVVVATIIVLNHFDLWEKFQSIESIRSLIESAGNYAIVVYGVIVILQVIILPIPSTATNFIASWLFSPWVNFIVTSLCTIAGSFICFWLGRFFGKKLVTWLIGGEKTEKYAKILNEKGRFLFVLMLLLPCFPDDVLSMVAGLSSMSLPFFAVATVLTRPVMIAVISFYGPIATDAIDTWGLPVSIGIVLLILIAVLLVMFGRDRKAKKKAANIKDKTLEPRDDKK